MSDDGSPDQTISYNVIRGKTLEYSRNFGKTLLYDTEELTTEKLNYTTYIPFTDLV